MLSRCCWAPPRCPQTPCLSVLGNLLSVAVSSSFHWSLLQLQGCLDFWSYCGCLSRGPVAWEFASVPSGCGLKRGLSVLIPCQGGTSPKVQLSSRAPHRTQARLGHSVSCPTVLLYLLCPCFSWEHFLISPSCRNPGL